jgi:hypothetical protein
MQMQKNLLKPKFCFEDLQKAIQIHEILQIFIRICTEIFCDVTRISKFLVF